jgi:hypothetical protein
MKLAIYPLTPDLWPAFEDLFGEHWPVNGCWCMYWRIGNSYRKKPSDANKAAFCELVKSGPPPGLLAFDGDIAVAVGWCQLTPRDALPWLDRMWRLRSVRTRSLSSWCEFDTEHVAHWLCPHLRARRIQDCCSTRTASPDYALRSEGDHAMTFWMTARNEWVESRRHNRSSLTWVDTLCRVKFWPFHFLGQRHEVSIRSAQRHFLRATSMTHSTIRQIERADMRRTS